MRRVPFFVEILNEKHGVHLCVCRKIMSALLRHGIAPLPSARAFDELRDGVAALKKRAAEPAIFVVNTFWAEDLVAQMDALVGQSPALFFVRDATSESVILPRHDFDPDGKFLAVLERMQQRSNSVWSYSAQNASSVAEKAAAKIIDFLKDSRFDHLATGEHSLVVPAGNSRAELTAAGLAPPPPPPAASVHGTLAQLSLSSLLVMFEMEKKSGELSLRHPAATARLFLRKGRVIAAALAGAQIPGTSKDGAEAVYFALRWKEGSFTFLQRDIDLPDQINTPVTALLMEGARRIDETPAATH